MTWREKCRICQELLVKVCSLLTTCIPEPNTSNNWQPFLVFIYPWQLEWPHFWWFHLSEDLYICFGSLSDLIFSSLVGKGLSSINPMDRFLFVCGTSKEGGGGRCWGACDPTLFLGRTEPMGLRLSPPLLLGSGWLGPHCLYHFAPQPTEHHCLLLVAGLVISLTDTVV